MQVWTKASPLKDAFNPQILLAEAVSKFAKEGAAGLDKSVQVAVLGEIIAKALQLSGHPNPSPERKYVRKTLLTYLGLDESFDHRSSPKTELNK